MKLNINKVYLLVGFVFIFSNLYSQNQKIADSLILEYNKHNIKDSSELEILRNIAFYHPNPDNKIYYSELLIELAEKKSSEIYVFRGYYQKGIALRLKGNLENAISTLLKSAEISEKINYFKGIGSAYMAIGDIYSVNENHKNSIFYFTKALNVLRRQNDSIFLGSLLLNIGNEYLKSEKLDSALNFFEESNLIFKKKNYNTGIAYCEGNIGTIQFKKGNLKIAEESVLTAISILKSLNDYYAIATFQTRLAEIYQSEKKIFNAIQSALLGFEIANKYGLKEQIQDASLRLSLIYKDLKDFSNAFYYQTIYYTYRDSINNNETIRKIADLRTEYEVSKKQAEVNLLIKKRNFNRIVTTALSIIIFLTLITLYLVYRNYSRKRALTKILQEQKEELKSQQEQLEELNRTKDRFFSIISHDLRGPIGSISSMPELFKEYLAVNDINELSGLIVHLETSMQKVSNLLDNLLNWALSQQGTFPYHPEHLVLNDVISEVYSVFSIMAETKKMNLVEDNKQEIVVIADRNSLMTILRNLLSNAVKFTPQGGTITISSEIKDNHALVKITDTGVGMAEAKLKTLFQLSERKSTWGTDREKGLGIGLSLVNDFVKLNKGEISVESTEGVGTTFTVSLIIPNNHWNI